MERIEADILIPGRGEPLHDGCVLLDGPTIAYAGPTAEAPPTPGAEIYRVPAVLPGLWDCHAHFRADHPGSDGAGNQCSGLDRHACSQGRCSGAQRRVHERPRGRRARGLGEPRCRGGYGHWSERVRGRSGPQPDRWSCRLAHVPRALGL